MANGTLHVVEIASVTFYTESRTVSTTIIPTKSVIKKRVQEKDKEPLAAFVTFISKMYNFFLSCCLLLDIHAGR